ncbi:MAG TPA: long-chain-fatty-acid--CoA ligase [Acidimicrobiales bacterium]
MDIRTTGEVIRKWAAERPEVDALRWGEGGRMSYAELDRRSSQVAQGFLAEGVGAEDRVAILDKNGPEYFEWFFGAAKVNAVPTPVNWRLAPPEVAYIVNDAKAKVFVVGSEYLPLLEQIAPELIHTTCILVVGEQTGQWESWDAWRDRWPAEDPMAPQADGDVAYQLYSSGTTGLPKGVQLTNRNLFVALPMYRDLMDMGEGSVNLGAMPLFHIGGGGWSLAGLTFGVTTVIVREIDPAKLVDIIEREGVTHGFLVPAVFQFMLMVPGVENRDFSKLRALLYGASPISVEVLSNSIRTFKCKFFQAYGLTETTGTVVLLPAEDHDPDGPNNHRLRAAGKAIPGVELRVVSTDTLEDAPIGEVGEIWVRSEQVMKGYWNLPAETAKSILPDGYFRTGDAAYLDADGYVYIHDRVKDMIVSGGENVYPAEVENVLMSHPAVADVAVIGVPSERWGETAKAVVVRKPGVEVGELELIEFCRERLAKYKCPSSVDWVDALPRNPSGKILKKDLRAPYWEGRERFVG